MKSQRRHAQILAIDLGTSACKVALVDRRGRRVADVTKSYPLAHPESRAAVQDGEDWRRALFDALGTIARSVARDRLVAIGLSGQMGSAVLIDESGQPLLPALTWLDQRPIDTARSIVGRLRRDPPAPRVYHGVLPLRVAWLRDRYPNAFARARFAFAAKDLVGWWLTGRRGTDPATAQAPLDWPTDLLAATGVATDLLPPVLDFTRVLGELRPEVAAATGLPDGVPVVVGAADGVCAALSCGARQLGDACVSLGTSSVARVVVEEPLRPPLPVASNSLPYVDGRWLGVLVVPGGAFLSWLARLTGIATNRLAELALDVAPEEGPVFLPPRPDRNQELLAGQALTAGGSLHFLHVDHRPADLARAIVDGTIYTLIAGLRRVLPSNRERISLRVTGGGADEDEKSRHDQGHGGPLSTIAALWEGPVFRAPGDATLGAAILAAVAVGLYPTLDDAVRLMATDLRPVRRHPRLVATHRQAFARYERLVIESPDDAGSRSSTD